MRKQLLILFFSICAYALLAQTACIEVNKIWDNSTHTAFTSLINTIVQSVERQFPCEIFLG